MFKAKHAAETGSFKRCEEKAPGCKHRVMLKKNTRNNSNRNLPSSGETRNLSHQRLNTKKRTKMTMLQIALTTCKRIQPNNLSLSAQE